MYTAYMQHGEDSNEYQGILEARERAIRKCCHGTVQYLLWSLLGVVCLGVFCQLPIHCNGGGRGVLGVCY